MTNQVYELLTALDLTEAVTLLAPLSLFILGIVFYSIFIFRFYRLLARRDIFKLNLHRYGKSQLPWLQKTLKVIFYVIEYVILFPVFAFFWFLVLAVFLSFLSKGQTAENILIVSMSVVASVRVTAYYKEDLSKDLAKLLPLALLGVFLVDTQYFSLPESLAIIAQILQMQNTLPYYLLFVIALEFSLRTVYSIVKALMSKK
ncbi:MAG: hypothetical protein JW778_06675 [Candidatus Altiarchaeota archaeon]|nr:hypothetical protein [Candidatus Altiarchaeota archaeon]